MRAAVAGVLSVLMLGSLVPPVTTWALMAPAAAGTTLSGDYVVIVNTNPDPGSTQSTGAILFDPNAQVVEGAAAGGAWEDTIKPLVPGVTGAPGVVTTTYAVGAVKNLRGMDYTCISVSDKAYVWMENGLKAAYDTAGKTGAIAEEALQVYEGKPYAVLNTLANGSIPYADNAGKLSILLERDEASTASGYYGSEEGITAIHIKAPSASGYMSGSLSGINGLLVHEGQHALFHLLAGGGKYAEDFLWLNEGLSVTAMEWTWGKQQTSQWLSNIAGSSMIRKGSPLVYGVYRGNTAQDYSMPTLYVRYLANRYAGKYAPLSFQQLVYQESLHAGGSTRSNEDYMDALLARAGMKNGDGSQLTFRQSLVDFYVAAVKQDASGIYSFYGDTTVYNSLGDYPLYQGSSGAAVQLGGTAAIVVKTIGGSFTVPGGAGRDIRFIAVNKTADGFRPAQGSGTQADPYILTTARELSTALSQYPAACFKLGADINLSDLSYASAREFTGQLDGGGHTISGIHRPLMETNTGVIRGVTLDVQMNDEYQGTAGTLACYNNGTIEDCGVTGTSAPRVIGASIRDKPMWGTLVGENYGTISRCYSTAVVTLAITGNAAHGSRAGNLVGKNSRAIKDSYTQGSLTVTRFGDTAGAFYVGGLAGDADGGAGTSFLNCYSVSAVSAAAATSGVFAGRFGSVPTVENCYAINTGSALGTTGSGSVPGKTEAELKTKGTYSGWNFNGIWSMPANAYPVHETGSVTAEAVGTASVFVGEALEYSKIMHVKVKLNNNAGNLISLTPEMVDLSTFDSSTPGTRQVRCFVRSTEFTLTVEVTEPTQVAELSIQESGKTAYVVGDTYKTDGVVLKAKLNGDAYFTYLYSGFTHDKAQKLTLSDHNSRVNLSYYGKTVETDITVSERKISGITITSEPDTTIYASGQQLSFNNLSAQISYNDGTKSFVLEWDDLQAQQIKAAKKVGSAWTEVTPGAQLLESDNGAQLYLYAASPGQSIADSTKVSFATLGVQTRLAMPDQVLVVKRGTSYTEAMPEGLVGDGNYNAVAQKISGNLPQGLIETRRPDGGSSDSFLFSGSIPNTVVPGDYPVTYEITRNAAPIQTIRVVFTFRVEDPKSTTRFEYYRLTDVPGVAGGIVEGVIDSDAGTITLTIPHGTTQRKFNVARAMQDGAESNDLTNGMGIDFTNPRVGNVVAENGVTTQRYTVTVVEAPAASTVTGVSVTPAATSVEQGKTQQFVATVTGTYGPSQAVTWSVSGALSPGTGISQTGLLTVAWDETATGLTVTASSVQDGAKSGTAAVTVTAKQALTYSAGVTPDAKDFGTDIVGYAPIGAETFTIQSTGTGALANLFVRLTGGGKDSFVLDTTSTSAGLDAAGGVNAGTTFTIRPNTGLAAGSYTAAVEVVADNMSTITSNLSFAVTEPPTYAVSGTITAGDTGVGLSGARLQLKKDGANVGAMVTTGADGGYTIAGVLPGSGYTIEVSCSGYDSGIIPAFDVTGTDVAGNNLTLAKTVVFVAVTQITGVPENATAGTKLTLVGTVAPDNATSRTIQWSLKDAGTTGASLTGSSLVAAAPGTLTVTATVADGLAVGSSYAQDFKVTVSEPPSVVSSVSVTPASLSMKQGAAQQFSAVVSGSNNPSQIVTWSVTGALLGGTGISPEGLLTVDGKETASVLTVTATSQQDTTKSAAAVVTIVPADVPAITPIAVTEVRLDKADVELVHNDAGRNTTALTATVLPENASNKALVWTSSDANIATVEQNGLVTAKAQGIATITATTADGNKTAVCKVTVTTKQETPTGDAGTTQQPAPGTGGTGTSQQPAAGGSGTGTGQKPAAGGSGTGAGQKPVAEYDITKGADGKWYVGSSAGLRLTCNGDYDKFVKLHVDGRTLKPANYTAEAGSTVVTLKPEYLETLSEGVHTLRFVYTDGYVQTEFTVSADAHTTEEIATESQTDIGNGTEDSENSVANDSTEADTESDGSQKVDKNSSVAPWMIWILVLAALAGAIIAVVVYFKSKNTKE